MPIAKPPAVCLTQAVPSWFVRVEDIKERLLANNAVTYWVPSYVKEKRFHNWLEGARDWVRWGGEARPGRAGGRLLRGPAF